MRLRRITVLLLTLTLASACSRVPGVYVYQAKADKTAVKPNDPATYVSANWAAKIVPTVHDKALDVATVAAAVARDPDAAGRKYGHQEGVGSPYAFMVKGTGTVTNVDTSVPTGPMTVEVSPSLKITIATGPVIAGTAVRDAVGFIQFGTFTNQIDYANAANLINARVKTDVIAKVDLGSVKGKKIAFYGAFSALDPKNIFLVPTELTVTP